MFLDATNKSLQVLLGGSVTTNQAVISSDWADNTSSMFTPGSTDILSNNTTAVTIVAAPAASTQRVVKEVNIYNADTVAMTVTVRIVSGANNRTQGVWTLQTGERLFYAQDDGWSVFTSLGAIKVSSPVALDSGTYTPVASNTLNVDSIATHPSQWMRVGNVVNVSGYIDIDTTAGGGALTQFQLTLPISSNIATLEQVAGAASGNSTNESGLILSHVTNDTAACNFLSNVNTARAFSYVFTYLVQ